MASLELGIVGNCTISALIDRSGTVVWSCFPRFDGDPLFCRLLDADGERGFYSIELDDLAEVEQSYLANTAVLVTRLTDGKRRRRRDQRFRAPLPAVRQDLPADHPDAHHQAVRGDAAHPDPAAAGVPLRPACPADHPRQQSHPLCRRRNQPAADHQCAADLPARGDAVHPGGSGRPDARPRRIAARTGARDRTGVSGADDRLLALADHAPVGAVRVAGAGDPRRHHAQALQLRGDRRHRGGDDHLDPRDRRPGAQLGLSLLLAARRLFRGPHPESSRLHRDDGGFSGLSQQHRRRERERLPAAGLRHRARSPG